MKMMILGVYFEANALLFLAYNTSGGSKYRETITKTFFKRLGLLIFYGLWLYNEMRLGTEQNTSLGPFKPFKNLTRFIG